MGTAISIISVVCMGITCMLAGYWIGKIVENERLERHDRKESHKKDSSED